MADTFDVVAGSKSTRYESAKEAGAAYFEADSATRPDVIHGSAAGPARGIAGTSIQGEYENGAARYLKSLPRSETQVDKDFRAGYLDALDKSVNERLKGTDWDAAKPAFPSAAPKLEPRLYDDLDQLSKNDFEKAAKAWEDHAPQGTTGPTFVDREWKRQNDEARQIAAVLDASERGPAYGVMTLDDKTVTSIRFERSEKEGEQAFNVSFHIGNKTVGKLKGIDGDTLADSVGEKNAKAIIAHGEPKGALKGDALMNEYGMSPEENARRSAMKEVRKAVELIQMEQLEPDAADEKNKVEPVKAKELEVIDGKEAVARANLLRQREREQLAREQESLGIKAEGKRITVENLSEKAREQDDVNDTAERTGGTTDRGSQLRTEREKNHQVELMEQVHGQFRVAGAKFHFKDQPGKIAFKDKGERMVSASNDDRVAKAMATMAEAKGWKTIKVSGHPDFQREVWLEANLRGIEARGYKPTEQDLKLLEDKRERSMQNAVEHDKTTRTRKTVSARENSPVEAAKTERSGALRNQWDVAKSDKAKVAEAVASALIDSKVKDPAQREALKAAVGVRMAEREKANKVPAVPVYDKAAPAKSQQPERTGPVVERNSERTR